jgi:hypothetical protein
VQVAHYQKQADVAQKEGIKIPDEEVRRQQRQLLLATSADHVTCSQLTRGFGPNKTRWFGRWFHWRHVSLRGVRPRSFPTG